MAEEYYILLLIIAGICSKETQNQFILKEFTKLEYLGIVKNEQ